MDAFEGGDVAMDGDDLDNDVEDEESDSDEEREMEAKISAGRSGKEAGDQDGS